MATSDQLLRSAVKRLFDASRETAVEVTVRRQDIEILLMAFAKRSLVKEGS